MLHLESQPLEVDIVRRSPRSNQDVGPDPPLVETGENPPAPDLPKPPLQEISLDNPMAMLRNDESEPGTRSGGSREEDVHVSRPLALPPLQQLADLRTASNAGAPREPLDPVGWVAGYLPPTCTTICVRPRRRRRFSVFRPPTVFMRARNPCLFTRLRLRGLYVGFITASPIHGCTTFEDELEKIAARL